MLSNLRILHPPCSDNPTNLSVLMLSVESQRYLFNAPEGLTRTLVQQGAKGISRGLGNVFIPRIGVQECAGLPGILMTLADAKSAGINIHGPPVLTHWLATCRSYLKRDNLRVQVKETLLSGPASDIDGPADYVVYQDQYITVEAVPIFPSNYCLPPQTSPRPQGRTLKRQRATPDKFTWSPTTSSLNSLQIMFPNDQKQPVLEMDEREAEEIAQGDAALREKLAARSTSSRQNLGPPPLSPVMISEDSSTTEQAPALLYIVRGKDSRGSLDVKKASMLGVPTGKLMGELTRGQDVELDRPKAWESWSVQEKEKWLKGRSKGFKNTSATSTGKEEELEKFIVKSSDVVGETKPGFVFYQVYLPSFEYLDSFFHQSVQSRLQSDKQPHSIVHAVHPDVLRDHRYQDFLHRFNNTHHMMVCRPFLPDRLAFPSYALTSLRMSWIDKDIFSPPSYNLEPELKLSNVGLVGDNIHPIKLDTNINLYPPAPPTRYDDLALDFDCPLESEKVARLVSYEDIAGRKETKPEDKVAKQIAWKKFVDHAKSLHSNMNNGHSNLAGEDAHLKITTLGTGSALPSKYRNVSATLLHLPGTDAGYILLDAGENTYGQLKRKFGERINEIVGNIRVAFLSHIHADHHMGTSRLLVERAKLNVQRPLFLIAPTFVRRYLEEVHQIFSLGLSEDVSSNGVLSLDSEHLDSRSGVVHDDVAHPDIKIDAKNEDSHWKEALQESAMTDPKRQGKTTNTEKESFEKAESIYKTQSSRRSRTRELRKHMVESLQGTQVFTVEVDHRARHCYGIVFRGDKWSGAYSGDTRPCQNLVRAGQGVDFLLHEATIDDSKSEMAHMKGHSTFGQAITIAKEMNVKYVVLTHFSQRYPKLPRLNAKGDLGNLKVGIAFDLLTIRYNDFDKLMAYREPLELLLEVDKEEDEEEDGEDRTGKEKDKTVDKDVSSGAASAIGNKVESGKKARDNTSKEDRSGNVDPAVMNPGQTSQKIQNNDTNEHRLFQRKFVKSHEFQFVSFELRPALSKNTITERGTPSRLSIAKAIENSIIELNGLVNGSFNWDLLHVQLLPDRNVVRVVVKVPSSHLETMRASISTGLVVQSDGIAFQARYDRTFSSLDLIALETDDGRNWFDSIVQQRNESQR